MTYQIILIAFLGILVGSFLNVCIYRIPRKESIVFPPSHCATCGSKLKKIHLIPVISYLLLKGRCDYCGCKIGIRYMFVELFTSFIWTILYLKYGFTIDCLAYTFLMTILIIIFFIDIDYMIIPDGLIITALLGGLLIVVHKTMIPLGDCEWSYWLDSLLGAIIGSGFLYAIALIGALIYNTNEAMGMGDVKLLAPIGIFLGFKMTILVIFLSVILAAIISIILIIIWNKSSKSKIAFGPFIVLGTFITIMVGNELINWWFNLMC